MAQTRIPEAPVESATSKAGDKPASAASRSPHLTTLPRPLTSDRVSFELSEEAMESLRLKLVSTPGLGAFGLRGTKPTSIHSPARTLPDPEYVNWQVIVHLYLAPLSVVVPLSLPVHQRHVF